MMTTMVMTMTDASKTKSFVMFVTSFAFWGLAGMLQGQVKNDGVEEAIPQSPYIQTPIVEQTNNPIEPTAIQPIATKPVSEQPQTSNTPTNIEQIPVEQVPVEQIPVDATTTAS